MTDVVHLNYANLIPSRRLAGQLLRLGLPSGITQAGFSMSMVFVQALANSMGYQVVTCTTAVMRIDGFAMMPNFTFGMAIATFVGQNIGANRLDRVHQGSRDMLKMSLITSFVLVGLLRVRRELMRFHHHRGDHPAGCARSAYCPGLRGHGHHPGLRRHHARRRDTMPAMWISMFPPS